jgi:hypothetical protein
MSTLSPISIHLLPHFIAPRRSPWPKGNAAKANLVVKIALCERRNDV